MRQSSSRILWRARRLWVAALLVFATAPIVSAQQTPAPVTPTDILPRMLSAPARKTPAARIDAALHILAEEHRRFLAIIRQPADRFRSSLPRLRVSDDDYVLIDAVGVDTTPALRAALLALGLRDSSQRDRIVSGWLPISALDQLESIAALRNARPVLLTTFAGAVTSQGDAALGADAARTAFGVDGTGVVVGVLSDSYNCKGGAATDIGSGDLPSTVTVLSDLSGSTCSMGTDEGRAMLQIVHDVAPGAQLAFHTAANGMADFANGILALRQSAGARVIVDDEIYFAEPMFQDGVIAQAVDSAVQQGAVYFSAAGNFASQSYESAFRGSGTFGSTTGGERHDFDPGSGVSGFLNVTIQANASVIVVLQWDQPFFSVSGAPGAATDLDLVLYNSAGTIVRAISATDNIGGDAFEAFQFQNNSTTNYKLAIERVSGPAPQRMKLLWTSAMTLQQFATNSSTVYGHANAASAVAVGASYYLNTPAFGVSPAVIESYSSLGGTNIEFDTTGAAHISLRNKPELVAPDGGDTTFFGSDTNGNGFPNFFGTSAAAPHAAGVAALMSQYKPQSTPAQIRQGLMETTLDMAGAGFDFRSGLGLAQANPALSWQSSASSGSLLGFSTTPAGAPLLGSVPLDAYLSQGVTLQTSDQSGGSASLSTPPTGGSSTLIVGSSLLATAPSGAPWIALQFSPPSGQVSFSFATASGQIQVDIYDGNAQLIGTTSFTGSTVIGFASGNRLAGTAAIQNSAPIGRIVIRALSGDADLRVDNVHFAPAAVLSTSAGADAPFPAWTWALLGAILIVTTQYAPRLRRRSV